MSTKEYFLTPKKAKEMVPASATAKRFLALSRAKSVAILAGERTPPLIIMGPCSIHSTADALLYAKRLHTLQESVMGKCHLVMRVYLEKPRTHLGWKGLLSDPNLDDSNDIEKGILKSRALLNLLAEMEVPVAAELLDPLLFPYIEEFVSWGFIGARTSTSQIHRQTVSDLSIPFGFKNSVDGNIENAIRGASCAQASHTFLKVDSEGRLIKEISPGNPHTHIVLRGSEKGGNCDEASIKLAAKLHEKYHLKPRILIDCAHGNSMKNEEMQRENFENLLPLLANYPDALLGVMIESFIESGKQPMGPNLISGKSITDPCLSWDATENLIHTLTSLATV